MKKNYFKFILILTQSILWSQNQHEPQKWKKLVSPQVNVIYKSNQEQDAFKIANTIRYIQKNNYKSIGYQNHPINIVLRANTTNSNGFVTYSPFRSEFFNTPPTTFNGLGTTDWLNTLAIHEYRHVQQFLNHKAGFTRALYNIFGELGWAVGSILAVPNWYFEGDAVVMETALTESGRGRLPQFTALQRALYKENIIYNYSKLRNQSYKNLTPNHYPTGYQILNYYRNNFDASKLDDIARKATSYIFPFYSFSHQLKKITGLTTKKIYKKSALESTKKWQKQRDTLNVITYKQHNLHNNKVNIYRYPQLMDNGSIISLKSTFNKIPAFYKLDSLGNETKITSSVISVDNYFHYHQNQITFTGTSYNPRYNFTDYSDIYIYNLNTNKRKKITHKKRYFSPAFNHNNSKIVVTETNQNNSKIVVLKVENGLVLREINLTGFISRPKFIKKNSFVYVKQQNHKVAIFTINKNAQETQITPWTSHTINNICVDNDNVYYSSSYKGIDNIYKTELTQKHNTYQITNACIGAYQPSVNNNRLYFTEQVSTGTKISSSPISSNIITYKEPIKMDWNNNKTVVFEEGNILNKIEKNNYNTYSYHSIFEDLKLHDWSYSLSDQIITANVTATNILNDFSLLASTDIYLNENNSFGISAIASYKKWFPILNLGIQYNHRDYNSSINNNNEQGTSGTISFDRIAITPSITIPISQVRGNYTNSFSFNIGYEYDKILNRVFTEKETTYQIKLTNPLSSTFNSKISFSSKKRTALQHINSHVGLSSISQYHKTIGGILNGYFFKTNNRLFLPGLFSTHNTYFTYAFQYNTINDGNLFLNLNADTFMYARGFDTLVTQKAHKGSFTYQLPLLYPDFGIAGITYFKRIRANLFVDYSKVSLYNKQNTDQHSTGLEIIFDNTFFNISQSEIGIGYRASYLLTKDVLKPKTKINHAIFISTTLF